MDEWIFLTKMHSINAYTINQLSREHKGIARFGQGSGRPLPGNRASVIHVPS